MTAQEFETRIEQLAAQARRAGFKPDDMSKGGVAQEVIKAIEYIDGVRFNRIFTSPVWAKGAA